MKVLVTGSDGYIGVQLTQVLCERGHDVVGLDTGFYRDGWLYDGGPAPMTTVRRDVRHIRDEDVMGYDAVVHLAELSNDPLGQQNPTLTYEINHRGSVNLALTCKRLGISRFVYSSSCSVYGAAADGIKTEDSETHPQTVYAECKVLVERDIRAMADDTFSPVFLRNATAFGASPRMRFDIVLNNLAGLAWTTREIKLTSDGSPWRPLVHVLDICEAIACALDAPRETIHGEVFNVGATTQNYRVKEIADIVAASFPGCAVSYGRSDGDRRSYRVSFDKIHAQLPGFSARRDAVTGARELYDVFRRISMSHETFQFRAYTRLKQLDYLRMSRRVDDDLFWRSEPAYDTGTAYAHATP
ncbi:MAG TPA: SDR family oxidoreductase [Chloroflexota bacterium]|nr:SDR family oxidoreductase [Chloroflexota bacterium]